METSKLIATLERPEVHRQVVGEYRGPYSLGVAADPLHDNQPTLVLQVESGVPDRFPTEVVIDGEPVRVLVRGGFRAPKPYRTTQRTL
jgi:hypothetical protein